MQVELGEAKRGSVDESSEDLEGVLACCLPRYSPA
jgi:hypothetical protein